MKSGIPALLAAIQTGVLVCLLGKGDAAQALVILGAGVYLTMLEIMRALAYLLMNVVSILHITL
jgi:hypothetical protein